MRPARAMAFLRAAADLEIAPSRRRARRFLNLDRMRRLCARLGHPERAPALLVHVAGTKGKGSTAAMTAALLRAAGLRTGLYTSPHVMGFGERIQVDGKPIAGRAFAALLAPHVAWARSLRRAARPTYFEWVTALAMERFRRRRCRAVVLEVGLGGRLDATNVVLPDVTAITRIGHDHTELLGRTLGAIAREKAGILKAGVPCVLAPQPPAVLRAIRSEARRGAAPLVPARPLRRLRLALPGAHQRENAAVALGILRILRARGRLRLGDAEARRVLAGVTLPGRVQILSRRPPLVVDGAHNPLSTGALASALREEFPSRRWTVVLGAAADKDLWGMLRTLAGLASRLVATPFESPRALPARVVAAAARRAGIPAEEARDPASALARTRAGGGPVCVAGSLWLAGEALRALGWPVRR